MKKIRFGIIGCGKIAASNHVPSLLKNAADAEIVAMYDIEPEKAKALAKKFELKVKFYKSEAAILAASDIDAVIIATPNVFHYPQTIAALKAGKHVLVEKPMSFTTAQADEMIDLSLKLKKVLQVNQSRRYNPLMNEVKRRIDEGLIGEVMHFRSQRTSTNSPNVSWSPGADWFVDPKSEGSLIGDIAVHMSDAMNWFCGPVKTLSAVTRKRRHKVEDDVFAMFNYAGGAVGTMELSWNFPTGFRSDEIYGTKGSLRLCCNGLAFEFIPAGASVAQQVIIAPSPNPYPNSHTCFLKAIRTKSKTAWEFGRNAIALVEAIRLAGAGQCTVVPNYRKK